MSPVRTTLHFNVRAQSGFCQYLLLCSWQKKPKVYEYVILGKKVIWFYEKKGKRDICQRGKGKKAPFALTIAR